MTKAELVDRVAERTGAKKKDVVGIIEAALRTMSAALRRHEKVQISGFGTFETRRRRARTGRNPRTQEEIKIGASWSLGFRPAKQLKNLVGRKASSQPAGRAG